MSVETWSASPFLQVHRAVPRCISGVIERRLTKPWKRSPAHVERNRFTVHDRDGRSTRRRDAIGVSLGRELEHDDRNDQHEAAHGERAAHERFLASDHVDQEQQEHEAAEDLDDAEEARDEQIRVAGTDGGEDLWTTLLQNLGQYTRG
jgi:hypothetical protein